MTSFSGRYQSLIRCQTPLALNRRAPRARPSLPRPIARAPGTRVVCSGVAAEKEAGVGVSAQPLVQVSFKVLLRVGFGDHVRLVGSHAQLGEWNTEKGKELGWTDGNVWTATVELPAGEEVQYKFVHVTRDKRTLWENTPNRSFTPTANQSQAVSTQWNNLMAEYQALAIEVVDTEALQMLEKPFFPAEEEQASAEAVAAAAVEAVLAPAPVAVPEAETVEAPELEVAEEESSEEAAAPEAVLAPAPPAEVEEEPAADVDAQAMLVVEPLATPKQQPASAEAPKASPIDVAAVAAAVDAVLAPVVVPELDDVPAVDESPAPAVEDALLAVEELVTPEQQPAEVEEEPSLEELASPEAILAAPKTEAALEAAALEAAVAPEVEAILKAEAVLAPEAPAESAVPEMLEASIELVVESLGPAVTEEMESATADTIAQEEQLPEEVVEVPTAEEDELAAAPVDSVAALVAEAVEVVEEAVAAPAAATTAAAAELEASPAEQEAQASTPAEEGAGKPAEAAPAVNPRVAKKVNYKIFRF